MLDYGWRREYDGIGRIEEKENRTFPGLCSFEGPRKPWVPCRVESLQEKKGL